MALSSLFLALRMGPEPAYLTTYLPGWLLGGVGVGLVLPNLMAGATHDLAPHQAATGSGVVAMDAFTTCFLVAAAVLVAASLTAFGMTARVRPTEAATAPGPISGSLR